jgi:hypothetical protein
MTTHQRALNFGPRLVPAPTSRLRSVVLVKPARAIESIMPLVGEPGPIYERALEQHIVFRKMLEYFGVETIVLESHELDPYETAAGDTAVAFGDGAVLMRLTAMSRRGEVDRMESESARVGTSWAATGSPASHKVMDIASPKSRSRQASRRCARWRPPSRRIRS